MRLRIWGVCALLCAGLACATLPPRAMAAVYSERQALPAQTVREFLSKPNALLAQFPDGGAQMIARVRNLAASNPATLNPLVGLLRTANARQSTAIGTGLAHTALMAARTDQAYANQIQKALAVAVGTQGATAGDNNGTPASAQPKIGKAVTVKDQVEGITEKGVRRLANGGAIYLDETLRIGLKGKAELLLADRTNLSILPQTEVRVEKFVYDPAGGPGRVVVDVHSGSLRFITGVQPSQNYEIRTPQGAVHVHGTEFVAVTTPNGLQIQVASGQLTVTSAAGQQVTLSAGNELSISSNGAIHGPTASTTPLVSFADLGLPTTNVTLAQALAAFSATTGNAATAATAATAAAVIAQATGAGGASGNAGGAGGNAGGAGTGNAGGAGTGNAGGAGSGDAGGAGSGDAGGAGSGDAGGAGSGDAGGAGSGDAGGAGTGDAGGAGSGDAGGAGTGDAGGAGSGDAGGAGAGGAGGDAGGAGTGDAGGAGAGGAGAGGAGGGGGGTGGAGGGGGGTGAGGTGGTGLAAIIGINSSGGSTTPNLTTSVPNNNTPLGNAAGPIFMAPVTPTSFTGPTPTTTTPTPPLPPTPTPVPRPVSSH
jgi:hypothetical protein